VADVTAVHPDELETHRVELTGYCYRMLGSGFEAEDAVQETMVRAWRSAVRREAPGALKAWLYRIATNVCLDMLQGAQRRARPMDMGPASITAEVVSMPAPLPETTWVQPIADAAVMPEEGDPAELLAARETVRLAFVAALQHLPPRQRAVLILREVLRWKASEVAELLGMTTASVNSALQRARATLDTVQADADGGPAQVDGDEERELLARYVASFESYDVDALVQLIRHDATFSMPPHPLWLRGPEEIRQWMVGPGIACAGAKVFTTQANGSPAMAIYKPDEDGVYRPFNIQVLDIRGGEIVDVCNFLDASLFPAFGFPMQLPADPA
jgi:RNA polymerase sigma-70 factor (ECF subfamily)